MESSRTEMILRWSKRILPVLIGAAGGYAYYHYIGCITGSCPITANPYISTGYGAIIGLLWAIPAKKKTNKKNTS